MRGDINSQALMFSYRIDGVRLDRLVIDGIEILNSLSNPLLDIDDARLTLPLQLTDGEGIPWRYDQRGWVSVSNVSQSIRYGFEPFINGRHSIPWATGSFADAAGREMVSQSASIDNIGVTRRVYSRRYPYPG